MAQLFEIGRPVLPVQTQRYQSIPPVLIKVQHTANMAFFRRLVKYAVSISEQYSAIPIIVIFCIHGVSQDFNKLTSNCDSLPSCDHFEMAKQILLEDVVNESERKRAMDCLDNGIRLICEIAENHGIDSQRTSCSTPPAVASSSNHSNGVKVLRSRNERDWAFADDFRRKSKRMNWEACFVSGSSQGYFSTFNNAQAAKANKFESVNETLTPGSMSVH
ncbi:hypothetical protein DM01DRAFT_1403045 [Hesseltinella vesiculosa]|uniref:Uncharacterized protein n=1 Tax=Hesseltinella vesiculosa TaxID=101127 RepID=A0A1X2GWV4_9FUNG|nr:hypothetical protein DM01DRAFT_1403045 [Hesseltinella vesiculosa]